MIENDGREVPRDMIDRLRDSEIQSLINERLIRYYVKTPPTIPPPPPPPTISAKGLGVHLKKLPKVIKLGHIHINPSNLYYENILSVRNPKNKPKTRV